MILRLKCISFVPLAHNRILNLSFEWPPKAAEYTKEVSQFRIRPGINVNK